MVFPAHRKLGATDELDAGFGGCGLRFREPAHLVVVGKRENVDATGGRTSDDC
jgi:hypothetical protein